MWCAIGKQPLSWSSCAVRIPLYLPRNWVHCGHHDRLPARHGNCQFDKEQHNSDHDHRGWKGARSLAEPLFRLLRLHLFLCGDGCYSRLLHLLFCSPATHHQATEPKAGEKPPTAWLKQRSDNHNMNYYKICLKSVF